MTTVVRSIALTGGLLALAGIQNASAQIHNMVEFTTSFPFTVGSATIPAGTYTIRPDDDSAAILELSGGRVNVFFETSNVSASGKAPKTEVVFKRYGNTYILKDVWLEGSPAGAESVTAEGERHAKKSQSTESEHRVAARKK